jgi:transcriptional regulator with XRE-family HTH domain
VYKLLDIVKSSHGGALLPSGARLKEERLRVGMSQQDLANHALVHRQTQVNYERSLKPPPPDYLEAVGKIGIDVEYVVTGYRAADGKQLHQAKNALLVMLLRALGYSDVDGHINEAVAVWNDDKPGPGMEGLAGKLVGEGPTVQAIRDGSDNIDTDLLIEAVAAAEEVLAKGAGERVAKRVILACELYRLAKQSGAIDRKLAKTLAALAD